MLASPRRRAHSTYPHSEFILQHQLEPLSIFSSPTLSFLRRRRLRPAFCSAFAIPGRRRVSEYWVGGVGIDPPSRGALTTNLIQMNNTSTLVGFPTHSKCHTLQYFCFLNLNPCNTFTKIPSAQNGPPRVAPRPCAKPIPCRVQIDVLFEIVAPAMRCPHHASPGGSPDRSASTCNLSGRRRTWDPSGRSR